MSMVMATINEQEVKDIILLHMSGMYLWIEVDDILCSKI